MLTNHSWRGLLTHQQYVGGPKLDYCSKDPLSNAREWRHLYIRPAPPTNTKNQNFCGEANLLGLPLLTGTPYMPIFIGRVKWFFLPPFGVSRPRSTTTVPGSLNHSPHGRHRWATHQPLERIIRHRPSVTLVNQRSSSLLAITNHS